MHSLSAYQLLGFILPWTWGISSRLLQQSAAAAPYLGQGYLLTAAAPLPDLERGIAPLGQGKEKQLRFAGAAVKRYPMSKVGETQIRW